MSDETALVRSTDPVTSKVNAVLVNGKLTALCSTFLEQLSYMGIATANEVAASLASDVGRINTFRRRATDLEKMGLIEVAGARICGVTGRKAQVYMVRGDACPK